MIDFRYHLVSIVSIFVALAVGIVLGAGPLQGGIGTQLTDQVSQLRQEKDTLRSQLDDSAQSVAAQEAYAATVATAALAGRLKERSVVLVATPDTAGKFAEDATTALQEAGATVTTLVTLKDTYRNPEAAPARLKAAAEAAAALGLGLTGADADTLTAQVLAALLMHAPGSSSEAPAGSEAALRALGSAGLLDVSTNGPARAGLAVVLGGQVTGTTDVLTKEVATLSTLVRTLDAAGSGVVVGAATPPTAVGKDVTTTLVTRLRADGPAAAAVSTVDHADSVVGAGVLVLALADQARGKVGHYGTAADAKADVPASP